MRETLLRTIAVGYVAAVVAPLPALAVGLTLPAVAVGAFVGIVLGGMVTARYEVIDQARSLPVVLVGFLPPVAWVAVGLWTGIRFEVLSYWLVGVVGVFLWLATIIAAGTMHQKRVRERLTIHVSFEARPPAKNRRQTTIAVAVLALFAGGAVVVPILLGGEFDPVTVTTLMPVWMVLLLNTDSEVSITDEGVLVDQSLHRWETIEGYELTDDALTISKSGWFRGKHEYDPADIENIEAVSEALDRSLTDRSVRE